MLNRFITAAVAVILSGCAGAPVISPSEVSSTYQVVELTASAAKTPVGLSVRGRPFGLDDQAMATQLVAMMPTTTPVGNRLAVAASPSEAPVHHLVFDFAAPASETAEALCRAGASRPTVNSGDRVTAFGALCVGVSPLNWAVGSTDQAAGPDSPAFRLLIQQMSFKLMPLVNPNNRGGAEPRLN